MPNLVDESEIIRSAVGRPRRALWLGGTEHSSYAEEQGAQVDRADVPAGQVGRAGEHERRDDSTGDGRRFDLVFVTERAASDGLGERLARSVPQLEDGGHVVVAHKEPITADSVASALRGVGLEVLWRRQCGGDPRSALTLTIARRRPEKRRLSLTVGMISMNEAAAVGKVIDQIHGQNLGAEVLLVDSSKDETPAIAEGKGARVVRQVPPRGYGPAMTRLLYAATTDVIVTMDCDGTYPANRIGELHARIEQGADLVNASRTHRWPRAMPLSNYVANRAFAAVAGVVHRYWTTDLHSGMRAYRTSMLRGIHVPEKGQALPVELLLVPARHGYRVEDVPIDYFERIGTTTLHRWESTKWTFRRIANAALRGGVRVP